MVRKPKRTFDDIDAARKRYNVRGGFGSPREWKGAFYERMGFEEAERVLNEQTQTPRQILGVTAWASWEEIAKAYRRKALETHPDRAAVHGLTIEEATSRFQRVQAAYSRLAREAGR